MSVAGLSGAVDEGQDVIGLFHGEYCPEELAVNAAGIPPLIREPISDTWDTNGIGPNICNGELWPQWDADVTHLSLELGPLLPLEDLLEEAKSTMALCRQIKKLKINN